MFLQNSGQILLNLHFLIEAEIQEFLIHLDYIGSEKKDLAIPNNCFRCIRTTGDETWHGAHASQKNTWQFEG